MAEKFMRVSQWAQDGSPELSEAETQLAAGERGELSLEFGEASESFSCTGLFSPTRTRPTSPPSRN
eukprot:scaffold1990_cov142-Pinguiococcus_pyrenoidosus.AAC.1